MMERRVLGRTGIEVSEIGLSMRWDARSREILLKALGAGCNLFVLDRPGSEIRRECAELKDSVLVHAAGGGVLTVDAGGRTWLGVEGLTEPPADRFRCGVLMASYSMTRMDASNALFPKAKKDGVGILADDVLAGGALLGPVGHVPFAAAVEKFRVLIKPGRTLAQAAIRFVLANEYVSSAIARVATPTEADEVLGAADAEALSLSELEEVFEAWAGRCEH